MTAQYFETPAGDDPLDPHTEITVVRGDKAFQFTLPRSVWRDLHNLVFDKGCKRVIDSVTSALPKV